jgi:hypothetical protein
MVALNFSSRTVAPNASLEPVPSGVYDVTVTNTQEKPTKDGQGSYIEFELTIRHPEPSLNNRKLFDRLNIKNKSQQAVDIAYATLSAICHVTQRYDIQDTAQLHGIPFKAVVAKVERNDRPGEFSNEVKGYKDAQGNDPGNPGAASHGPGPAPQGGGQPGYGGQPNGGQPNGGYSGGQGNAATNGQQYQPNPQPGPGQAQQTSDQHYAAGPQGGAPQGGQPGPQGGAPAWAQPQGGAPQGQAQPQGGQPYQQQQPQPQPGAPQGGQPQAGYAPQPEAPPPWAQPQG